MFGSLEVEKENRRYGREGDESERQESEMVTPSPLVACFKN